MLPRLALLGSALAAACAPAAELSSESGGAALERVVAIGPGTEANLFALGLGGSVVGVSDFCAVAAASDLPRVGGQQQPNLERIAGLRPDLLLVQGRHPEVEAWCRGAGVGFHSFATDSVAGWREEVAWIGDRFGIPAESDRLLREAEDAFAALLSAAPAAPRRTLLVVARRVDEPSGILAAGPRSFLSELLVAAGGVNVLPEGVQAYVDLNEETLIRLDPERILEFWPEGAPDPPPTEVWRRAFPSLAAVRTGGVAVISDRDALIPGPRMPDVARAIATALR